VRWDSQTKVVLGRNARENAILLQFAKRSDVPELAVLEPENFQGPTALIVGSVGDAAVRMAAQLLLARTRRFDRHNARARLQRFGGSQVIRIAPEAPDRPVCP